MRFSNLVLILISLSMLACAPGGGSTPAAETARAGDTGQPGAPAPAPVLETLPPSPRCQGHFAVGSWSTGNSADGDLTVGADCSLTIAACGTIYDVQQTLGVAQNQPATLTVRANQFVQDGCLRPGVGAFQCTLAFFDDVPAGKRVLNISCADDNFYHVPYSKSWRRPL